MKKCSTCITKRIGCGCDGALDDGCFLCTPECHVEPPCTCVSTGRLIALTGPAGCGKTTIAQALERQGFVRVRFAALVKDMLRVLGLTDAQVDGDQKEVPCDLLCGKTPRQAMQLLGTDYGREMIGPDVWVNGTTHKIDQLLAAGRDVVVDDLRFDNEAHALALRDAFIFELQRAGAGTIYTHASEAGIAREWIAAAIDNNGTVPETLARLLAYIESDTNP